MNQLSYKRVKAPQAEGYSLPQFDVLNAGTDFAVFIKEVEHRVAYAL